MSGGSTVADEQPSGTGGSAAAAASSVVVLGASPDGRLHRPDASILKTGEIELRGSNHVDCSVRPSYNNHSPPSACAFAWGAFYPDSGEHRTHHNDAGRCCTPVPLRVPHAIYVKMTPHELMMNAPVVCDEADAAWVGQEVQNRQEAEHSERTKCRAEC
jgi:hypothetical protein